ncbi:MAG: hypothetical protein MK193_11610 [Lentisphaeria bacterium]|nr:hypothetical protein [Lentisphaeria bacterium]
MNHADSTKEEKFTHVYAFICTITLILATYFTFIPKPVESNLKLDQSNNKLSYINSLSTQMQNSDFSDEFKDYLSISRPFMTLPTDNDPLLKKLDVGFYDRSQEVSYKLINTDVSFKVPIEETIITLPEPLSIDQILPTVDLSVAKNQTLLSPLSSEEITPPVSLAWQVSPAFKNDFLNAPEEDLIPASEIFVTGSTVIQVNSQTITPFIKNIPVISLNLIQSCGVKELDELALKVAREYLVGEQPQLREPSTEIWLKKEPTLALNWAILPNIKVRVALEKVEVKSESEIFEE